MNSTITKKDKSKTPNFIINVDSNQVSFTADEVIDAYLKGTYDGKNHKSVEAKKEFRNNILKTLEHTKDVYDFLHKNTIEPLNSFLKVESQNEFKVIVVITEKDYIKRSFLETYNHLASYESKINKDKYHICFFFTSLSEDLSEESLAAEGFRFKHTFNKVNSIEQ